MKLKYRALTLILAIAFTASSCNDWLNMSPKNLVTEEDLFSEGTGFRNALNGIYQQMSSSKLWGRELTWGAVDVMGQCYKTGLAGIPSGYAYYNLARYDYEATSVKTIIQGVWEVAYNSIANCNNIIGKIENTPSRKFIGGSEERNLILGEALALRGFLHFELLRLYAPSWDKKTSDDVMPYFEKFPSIYEPSVPATEVVTRSIRDLEQGYHLVAPFDTLNNDQTNRLNSLTRSSRFRNSADDIFYGYRGYRMNYGAIAAVLARIYNYTGNHAKAEERATEVIAMKLYYNNLFAFTKNNKVDGNRKMSDDLIFGLSDVKLYENYEKYDQTSSPYLIKLVMRDDVTTAFDDGGDYRKNKLLQTTDRVNYRSTRYVTPLVPNDDTPIVADILPMIRLSEMYYIQAESYASRGEWAEAADALDQVRAGRNCTKGRLTITDMTAFQQELIKEVRREFLGEGQVFHYYKRLGILPKSDMNPDKFTLTRPDSEQIH